MKKISLALVLLGIFLIAGCSSVEQSGLSTKKNTVGECVITQDGERINSGLKCNKGEDCVEPVKKMELGKVEVSCEETELKRFKLESGFLFCKTKQDCVDVLCEENDEECKEMLEDLIVICDDNFCKGSQSVIDAFTGSMTVFRKGEG